MSALLRRCLSISLTNSSAFALSFACAARAEEEEDEDIRLDVSLSCPLANAKAFNLNSDNIRKCSSSSALSASVFLFKTSENRFFLLPLLDVGLLPLSLRTLSCSDAEADREAPDNEALELALDKISPVREEV